MTEIADSWRDRVIATLEGTDNPHLRSMADMLYPGVLPESPPPTVPLSHYTTVDGLQGILSSGCLRATEAQYLNDSTERDFGHEMIEAILVAQEQLYPGTRLPEMLRSVRSHLSQLRQDYAQFVVCFCEKADLLSMWTGYAASGGGYSIEFDGASVARLAMGSMEHFVKVAYGDELRTHPLVAAFERSCARIARMTDSTARADLLGAMLTIPLDTLFVRLKHPAFEQEREWRALIRVPSTATSTDYSAFNFRATAAGLKPFIELRMPSGAEGVPAALPITRVTIGPTLRPDDAIRAVRWLLRKHGYPETVAVEASRVPYRG